MDEWQPNKRWMHEHKKIHWIIMMNQNRNNNFDSLINWFVYLWTIAINTQCTRQYSNVLEIFGLSTFHMLKCCGIPNRDFIHCAFKLI
jgi:hypothetical protein